jgi:MFS family permease
MLAYEFPVSLPVIDHSALHGGAAAYGLMTAAMGIGAVIGGLFTAARGRTGIRPLSIAAAAFGVMIVLASLAPDLPLELAALAGAGAGSVSFMAIGNSTLQLGAAPQMRGRVMSLWFVAFQGSTPIGGPLVGWVIAAAGARVGLGLGGVTLLVVAAFGALVLRRPPRGRAAAFPARAA